MLAGRGSACGSDDHNEVAHLMLASKEPDDCINISFAVSSPCSRQLVPNLLPVETQPSVTSIDQNLKYLTAILYISSIATQYQASAYAAAR